MKKITLALALFLVGCSLKDPIDRLRPYKIDIHQGNEVTQAMLDQLKPGMTPAQVRYILGTPLIVDPFHVDRWDYVLRVEQAGKVVEQRRVMVIFREGRLQGIQTDGLSAAAQGDTP